MKDSLFYFLTNNFNDIKFSIIPSDCEFEISIEWNAENGIYEKRSDKISQHSNEKEVIDAFTKLITENKV